MSNKKGPNEKLSVEGDAFYKWAYAIWIHNNFQASSALSNNIKSMLASERFMMDYFANDFGYTPNLMKDSRWNCQALEAEIGKLARADVELCMKKIHATLALVLNGKDLVQTARQLLWISNSKLWRFERDNDHISATLIERPEIVGIGNSNGEARFIAVMRFNLGDPTL